MASSTIPVSRDSEAEAASGDLVKLRAFPQLKRRNALPSDRARELYARAMNNPHSFWLLNKRYVEGLEGCPAPELTAPALRVADDLVANGIAFAHFTEFFDADFFGTITDCFHRYLDDFQRAASPGSAKGKGVFLDTIHKAHTFLTADPVSTYLAAPQFAAIAARYMGMVPRFVGSSFWRTRATASDERIYSQLWHRDYNDRMLVKVFLYITDVGPQEGCFEYVVGSHECGPLGDKFDRIGPDGFRAYPEASTLDEHLAPVPVVQLDAVGAEHMSGEAAPWRGTPTALRCVAPRATLIFADTFGLHRGGFVESGFRDMIMTTYSTNFNVHKPHFAVTRGFADTLTPFMRMSFGIA